MTATDHKPESALLSPGLEGAVTILVDTIVVRHGTPAPLSAAEETIELMRPAIENMFPESADPLVFKLLARTAIQRIAVDIEPPVVIKTHYQPWFVDAVTSGEIQLARWYSYKQHLMIDKGFPPQVLDSIDQSSSEVVDLLGDPRQQGTWKRRGLVIGEVQSGKTATYIGIVNKAADAGYKLVVLLTGGTESLRKQTQFRVDEGFLGNDSSVVGHDKALGVGRHAKEKFLRGQGMTTYAKDFVETSLGGQNVQIDPNADHPYVFVIKKNKTPLTNLIKWLSGQFDGSQFDIPMLVVDDESDYASVNTNYGTAGDQSPTLINQRIRELLALTTRSSYMAFTATPFANVFIDHASFDEALMDDLFPHHYIFSLSAPSNYVGAARYFGTTENALSAALVDITDAHDVFPPKHKSTLSVPTMPASLEESIRSFVVASAIRLARGDKESRSMLVNVSRFKHVQNQVHELVTAYFARIKNAIELHAQPPVRGADSHSQIAALGHTFNVHFSDAGVSWEQARDKLLAVVIDTTVVLVNSSRDKGSDDKLHNMIAVGGDVLSRGLTLEGLTVSYFYRIVGSADTLLQMARWFGYRPGYEDLVRIWISPDVSDQFRFVGDICRELTDQVATMRDLGRTPADFGLMVRKHPESLAITAKKGVAETKSMVISLSGRRIETTKIPAAENILEGNWAAVLKFLEEIDSVSPGVWEQPDLQFKGKIGVPKEQIAQLLAEFRYDRGNLIMASSLDKILRDQSGPVFQNWTVGVVHGSGTDLQLLPGLAVRQPKRAVRHSNDGISSSFRVSGSSARLAGSTDLARTYSHDGEALTEPDVYADLPNPTLLIYPLEPSFDGVQAKAMLGEAGAEEELQRAQAAWASVQARDVAGLMALKLAIPGRPGSKAGDVKYWLNGPAIEEFAEDYNISAFDADDLDE